MPDMFRHRLFIFKANIYRNTIKIFQYTDSQKSNFSSKIFNFYFTTIHQIQTFNKNRQFLHFLDFKN